MRVAKKLGLFLLIVGICVIVFGGIYAAAEENAEPAVQKYYTSVRIEAGDTLWDLADEYGNENIQSKKSYIQEIKRINHLTDDTIRTGCYLTVVYYPD